MDYYLLTLYVSLEQELAIRELFVYNGWNFNKYQDSTYESYTSKQDTSTCLSRKNIQDLTDASQTKLLIGETSTIKNVDLDADTQTEIFSDLQHFVEATLIAVTKESDKTDHRNSEDECNEGKRICDINQPCTSSSASDANSEACGTSNDGVGTSHNICVNRSDTDTSEDPADAKGTVNGLQESSMGTSNDTVDVGNTCYGTSSESSIGTSNNTVDVGNTCYGTSSESSIGTSNNSVDVGNTYYGTSSDFTMVNGSVSGTSNNSDNNETYSGTSNTLPPGNQPLSENNNVISPSKAENAAIKSDMEETVHNNFKHQEIQGNETSPDILKVDKNVTEKRVLRKNKSKKRNEPKGKTKVKDEKVEKRKNAVISETTVKSRKKSKVGLFHCKECDYTFRFLGAYKNHKKDGKCLFECEYCGKTFTSRYYSNYQSHLKYHVKDRPHKCNVCGKTYIEAQTLKIHMRKHSGDRPYVCHHCGLQFYSSSNLLSHRNSAHSDTREIHKCDICDATLSTLGNLRVHKKVVHAVERPFTCEICGKSFKTQKSLEQVHAKVHSEDFPYKCDFIECGKMFKRSEGLADHMRRHNNNRNHFCEKCGKGFYSNKDLTLHMRTHTGEKPHMCQLCDYKCALAGNLRKHMKTHLSAQ